MRKLCCFVLIIAVCGACNFEEEEIGATSKAIVNSVFSLSPTSNDFAIIGKVYTTGAEGWGLYYAVCWSGNYWMISSHKAVGAGDRVYVYGLGGADQLYLWSDSNGYSLSCNGIVKSIYRLDYWTGCPDYTYILGGDSNDHLYSSYCNGEVLMGGAGNDKLFIMGSSNYVWAYGEGAGDCIRENPLAQNPNAYVDCGDANNDEESTYGDGVNCELHEQSCDWGFSDPW